LTPGGASQTEAAIPSSPAALPSPPPPPPPLYAPPPPPKLEDLPDAGATGTKSVAKGTGGTGVAASGPGTCGATCNGQASGVLSSALRGAASSAQGCYMRALRTSEASGRMTVNVQVAQNGTVCNASITDDAVHSGEISSCVLSRFRGKSFPPPQGGCVSVNIPINFSIKQ
jgi:TonB family protein